MNNAKATGVPFAGQGGSLAHACKMRKQRLLREIQAGHSMRQRLGASRKLPSFVCLKESNLFKEVLSNP